MRTSLSRLLERSIGPVNPAWDEPRARQLLEPWGTLGKELASLLAERNGIYAFDSALFIRPVGDSEPILGIERWNESSLWRATYPDLCSLHFFAEDVFGNQFAIAGDQVIALDAETGEQEMLANSIEGWLATIYEDATYWTGWPLAHEWQEKYSAIPLGHRLLPKRPFVLGGEYALENLVVASDVDGMRARGALACQLRSNPPGSEVTYELKLPRKPKA